MQLSFAAAYSADYSIITQNEKAVASCLKTARTLLKAAERWFLELW